MRDFDNSFTPESGSTVQTLHNTEAANTPELTVEALKEMARIAAEGKSFSKRIRRGPQHGNSPAAIGFRALQSRGVIGRHKPFPVGGMTHCAAKRLDRQAAFAA